MTLDLEDFVPDAGGRGKDVSLPAPLQTVIHDVVLQPLIRNSDKRGSLVEILSGRYGLGDPIVHVYQVFAEPDSVRAWVYHEHQSDRLAFTVGRFRVVLFDLRPDSPTCRKLDILELGEETPCLLTIPRYVAHGVQNLGESAASFLNLPTRVYDHAKPDKRRLAWDDPRIPFRFERKTA